MNLVGNIDVPVQVAAGPAPDWLVAEMPQVYHTRIAEVHRLSAAIHAMDRIGRLLWQVGQPLKEAVRDVFVALKFEAELVSETAAADVLVKLDARRRLLLLVSEAEGPIYKKDAELARVFQILHQFAGDDDRVVLVTNSDRASRPVDRPDPMTPDALNLLRRMGANFLTTPTLFAVWTVSLQDQNCALAYIEQLHARDGGIFLPPSA